MIEALIWTSALAALVLGWSAARVLWHLLSLPEYEGVSRAGSHVTGGRARHAVSDAPPHPGQ